MGAGMSRQRPFVGKKVNVPRLLVRIVVYNTAYSLLCPQQRKEAKLFVLIFLQIELTVVLIFGLI